MEHLVSRVNLRGVPCAIRLVVAVMTTSAVDIIIRQAFLELTADAHSLLVDVRTGVPVVFYIAVFICARGLALFRQFADLGQPADAAVREAHQAVDFEFLVCRRVFAAPVETSERCVCFVPAETA